MIGISPAMAWDEDTHFQVTFIILRTAGFTEREALIVAAVDQGMDDSPKTIANTGAIPHPTEEWLWHALDRGGEMGAKGIAARKAKLFKAAENQPDKLWLLGVFYHYQGDTWSHRHHYDGDSRSYDNYTTYDTPAGHSKDFFQPDRPPFDPIAAVSSFHEGLMYAKRYLREVLKREPNKFAQSDAMGPIEIDKSWKNEGKYFHQILISGPPQSTERFIRDVIRAQINAYDYSSDPLFGFRNTSNEADFETVRAKLQDVCNMYIHLMGYRIVIPTKGAKLDLGFTAMTTDQLIRAGMPGS